MKHVRKSEKSRTSTPKWVLQRIDPRKVLTSASIPHLMVDPKSLLEEEEQDRTQRRATLYLLDPAFVCHSSGHKKDIWILVLLLKLYKFLFWPSLTGNHRDSSS